MTTIEVVRFDRLKAAIKERLLPVGFLYEKSLRAGFKSCTDEQWENAIAALLLESFLVRERTGRNALVLVRTGEPLKMFLASEGR